MVGAVVLGDEALVQPAPPLQLDRVPAPTPTSAPAVGSVRVRVRIGGSEQPVPNMHVELARVGGDFDRRFASRVAAPMPPARRCSPIAKLCSPSERAVQLVIPIQKRTTPGERHAADSGEVRLGQEPRHVRIPVSVEDAVMVREENLRMAVRQSPRDGHIPCSCWTTVLS